MFEQYTKFFHLLSQKGGALQGQLGDEATDLVKALRDYPDIARPSVDALSEYSKYLKDFIHFGLSQPTLRAIISNYFDDKVISWAMDSVTARLAPLISKKKLSVQEVTLIQAGRVDAIELAAYLEHARARTGQHAKALNDGFEVLEPPAAMAEPIPVPAAAAPAPQAAPAAAPRRDFFVTAHEPPAAGAMVELGPALDKLRKCHAYVLRMGVSRPQVENLASGDTSVGDIPAEGLPTHWVLTSRDVSFVGASSSCTVRQIGELWEASFDLLVPASDDSRFEALGITTGEKLGQLQVAIYVLRGGTAEREMYRELTVDLAAKELVTGDDTIATPAHTLLRTSHEWTTPPVHVQVRFWKESALITMMRGAAIKDYSDTEEWNVTATRISGYIDNVRSALEALREKWSAYFDAIDAGDMASRLPTHYGALFAEKTEGWQPLPDAADAAHNTSFDAVQASEEWFALSSAGYALYDACFAQGTRMRAMLDELKPGSRIDFQWTEKYGNGWVPHVPWALMHIRMPDVTRVQPVDPEAFLGLRLRLGSQAWSTQNPSRALVSATPTNALNLLYWGSKAGDDVAVEAQWQAQEFASWGQAVLPKPGLAELKRQVVLALDTPAPAPVGVVYLYCHCSVGNGDTVALRFGDTSKPQDVLTQVDLSFKKLADAPMLFANACTTAQADPFKTSLLESLFFGRGARAFIGTETKVPVQLASKFAWLYFQFFYRRFDPEPMAAGEALTQARMFLWTQYRNVGGLFYSLVNQYDLYFASYDEVVALKQ